MSGFFKDRQLPGKLRTFPISRPSHWIFLEPAPPSKLLCLSTCSSITAAQTAMPAWWRESCSISLCASLTLSRVAQIWRSSGIHFSSLAGIPGSHRTCLHPHSPSLWLMGRKSTLLLPTKEVCCCTLAAVGSNKAVLLLGLFIINRLLHLALYHVSQSLPITGTVLM